MQFLKQIFLNRLYADHQVSCRIGGSLNLHIEKNRNRPNTDTQRPHSAKANSNPNSKRRCINCCRRSPRLCGRPYLELCNYPHKSCLCCTSCSKRWFAQRRPRTRKQTNDKRKRYNNRCHHNCPSERGLHIIRKLPNLWIDSFGQNLVYPPIHYFDDDILATVDGKTGFVLEGSRHL